MDLTPRSTVLGGAIAVSAADFFAAREAVAGSIALACLAVGAAASRIERRPQEWLLAALAAHVVLGMAGGLYERSALYDKLVHCAVSFGLARLVAAAPAPRWLAALAALGLGALWELFEFTADATGLVTAQRGLADTMGDLAADAAGALAGAALALSRPCRRDRTRAGRAPAPASRRSRPRS
jgi:hypothetical protein